MQVPHALQQAPAQFLRRLYQCFDTAAVWAWRSEPMGFACLREALLVASGLMEMGLLTEVSQRGRCVCMPVKSWEVAELEGAGSDAASRSAPAGQ